MTRKNSYYRKADKLFHNETHEQIIFGKFLDDGSASCIGKNNSFLTIPRDVLDAEYTSYRDVEKQAKERRRGQGW